jgi:hypothetical protein
VGEHRKDTNIAQWERERDSLKTRWVLSVIAFWGTIVIQAIVYYLNETLSFVLLSIIFGMMALGVVLKARWQLHVKNKPED